MEQGAQDISLESPRQISCCSCHGPGLSQHFGKPACRALRIRSDPDPNIIKTKDRIRILILQKSLDVESCLYAIVMNKFSSYFSKKNLDKNRSDPQLSPFPAT
jgi:hypothetical protein